MNYIIKPLNFKEVKNSNSLECKIKIHNIIDMVVGIVKTENPYTHEKGYKVCFIGRGFDFAPDADGNTIGLSYDRINTYIKFGFDDIEKAKAYAQKEINTHLTNFIECTLADLGDYIDEYEEI